MIWIASAVACTAAVLLVFFKPSPISRPVTAFRVRLADLIACTCAACLCFADRRWALAALWTLLTLLSATEVTRLHLNNLRRLQAAHDLLTAQHLAALRQRPIIYWPPPETVNPD